MGARRRNRARAARRDFRAALLRAHARDHRRSEESLAQQGRAVAPISTPARIAAAVSSAAARRRSPCSPTRAFFQGSLADLEAAAAGVSLPVLRKDFTIAMPHDRGSRGPRRRRHPADRGHPHASARSAIFAKRRRATAWRRWWRCTTAANWTRPSPPAADIIGVNNRNLTTFEVTLETSLRLAEHMPAGVVRVSESGIHNARGYRARCAPPGYTAFLVGEHLMKSGDPRRRCDRTGGGMIRQDLRHHQCRKTPAAAIAGGATAIGFNFYPRSPRYIAPERAAGIVTATGVRRVGVFVNETARAVEAIARIGAARRGATARRRDRRAIIPAARRRSGRRCAWPPDFDLAPYRQTDPAEALLLDGPAPADLTAARAQRSTGAWPRATAPHHPRRRAGCLERRRGRRSGAPLGRGRLLAHRKRARARRTTRR